VMLCCRQHLGAGPGEQMIWGLSKESPIEPLRSGQRHFCHDRRTADAVVSIRVVGRDAPELVARELRCHLVVGLDSSRGRVTSKRADLQERRRCCRAVQVAVVQDRTGEGALRAASFGCRSITSLAPSARIGRAKDSALRCA
jgi:hypothetical protein